MSLDDDTRVTVKFTCPRKPEEHLLGTGKVGFQPPQTSAGSMPGKVRFACPLCFQEWLFETFRINAENDE